MKRIKKILKGRYSGKVVIYLLMCCLVLNTSLPVVLADAVPGMIEGENVTSGSATFTTVDDTTTIQTGGMETIIEYTRFNVDGGKTVHFDQPDISAATLNRIIEANPSLINGTLTSNGRVFIINPAGIVFGEGSQVNVAQFVASGLHMSNTDFSNAISDPTQQMIFTGGSGDVTNNGTITATNSVYLVGEDVLNNGAILCPDGLVVMAAGDTLRLGQPGSSVFVDISTDLIADIDNFASNSGTLGEVDSPVGQVVLAN